MRRAPLLLLLLLAACGSKPSDQAKLDRLDGQLTATPASNLGDPAIVAAVSQPIMTDPTLAQSSNADAIRPPSRPDPIAMPTDDLGERPDPVDPRTLRHAPAPGQCPQCRVARASLTLGALAAHRNPSCAADVRYDPGWAAKLPRALPVYPDARVIEAAGNDAESCRLRVVSFATAAPAGKVIDWYFTHAAAAGLSAEHQADGREHVLGGAGRSAAYMLYVTTRPDGGTLADLVVSEG